MSCHRTTPSPPGCGGGPANAPVRGRVSIRTRRGPPRAIGVGKGRAGRLNLIARLSVLTDVTPVYVIGGAASTALGERVSRELGNAPFGIPFVKRFPDGELYVRVGGRLTNEE